MMDRCGQAQMLADKAATSHSTTTKKIRDKEAFEAWQKIATSQIDYPSSQRKL
jgi:hypothetical protein